MKLYTGIDIGNNSIKIAVFEKDHDTFNLLAKEEIKSSGLKKGMIINSKALSNNINSAITNIEKKLKTVIKKCVIAISSQDVIYDMVDSEIMVEDPTNITGDDITKLIKNAVAKKRIKDYELVTSTPVGFKLDNGEVVNDPKGLKSDKLYAKVVATYVPQKNLYGILEAFQNCGIEVIDITLKPIADYYEVRTNRLDKEVGIIVNIGEDSTSISLYNKGIMIKNGIINNGSMQIDHDISFKYKISSTVARDLKENFVVVSNNVDNDLSKEITNDSKEKIVIKQAEVSELVRENILDLLEKVKNEIKNLTNREISYIIILGGLSEIKGLQDLLDAIHMSAVVYKNKTIGLRHNKYTTLIGTVKYFDDKLALRDIDYDMFESDHKNSIIKIDDESMELVDYIFEGFINEEDKV